MTDDLVFDLPYGPDFLPMPIVGLEQSWMLDFSREAFPPLDETALDESAGIGGHAGHLELAFPSTEAALRDLLSGRAL